MKPLLLIIFGAIVTYYVVNKNVGELVHDSLLLFNKIGSAFVAAIDDGVAEPPPRKKNQKIPEKEGNEK